MEISISAAPLDFSLSMRNAIRSEASQERHNPSLLKLLQSNGNAAVRAKDTKTNSAFRIVTPKLKIEGTAIICIIQCTITCFKQISSNTSPLFVMFMYKHISRINSFGMFYPSPHPLNKFIYIGPSS